MTTLQKNQNNEQLLQEEITFLRSEVARLRQLAERDDLTGCLRREAFLSMIEERRRFGWLGQNTTLAVIDIDHFKKVNDTHGHLSGDEALRTVAQVLTRNLPEGALLCRMGGEEFVVLLEGSVQENQHTLETLRKRIATTPVRLREGVELRLTASFGAVTWNTDTALLQATAAADACLYEAKRSGRNRIVSAQASDENLHEDFLLAS